VDHDPKAVRASVDRHIHNTRRRQGESNTEHVILVAHRPFHVLDEIVYSAPRGALGMVFEEGSLLCHLAVVMREHAVPGFIWPNVRHHVADGDLVVLDATPGAAPTLRRL
jgi:phosphohistidine swiveling domain-containing protein